MALARERPSPAAPTAGGTEWIGDLARFASVAPAWDELASLAPDPFSSHAWLTAWWRAFGQGRLAVCVLWDAGELAAGFPLSAHGRSLRALANTETPAFRPVARDPEALAQVSAAVIAAGGRLEVPNLPEAEPAYGALRAAARAAGRLEVAVAHYESPVTDTTGTWEAYRGTMKQAWRELERRGRKMEREHVVELRLCEPPEDLTTQLDEGLRLEAAGWKGSDGTAILSSPAMAEFYREIAGAAHDRGELRLSSLRMDGRLVAFDLAVVARRRYFLLKTAFDESARRLAPGLVLRRAVIRRCHELELESHDFLGETMPWKQLFATGSRRYLRYRAYDRRPAGLVRYAYRGALRPAVKRVVRSRRATGSSRSAARRRDDSADPA